MRRAGQFVFAPGAGARRQREADREDREEHAKTLRLAAMNDPCACGFAGGPGLHAWDCIKVPCSRRVNYGQAPA